LSKAQTPPVRFVQCCGFVAQQIHIKSNKWSLSLTDSLTSWQYLDYCNL